MFPSPGLKKLRKVFYLVLLVIFGFIAADSPAVQRAAQNYDPGYYEIAQVLDGDTIVVNINGQEETVRYIGVDTPETHDPRKPVQCFGQAATTKHRELTAGKKVRLKTDVNDSGRDKYRRLLRYVYLPDGTLINAEMIEEGYGFVYTIYPFEKMEEFRQLERSARQQNKGLWASCQIKDGEVKETNPEE